MDTIFEILAEHVALGAEMIGIALIGLGAADIVLRMGWNIINRKTSLRRAKDNWLRLGVWILLALEFELGADIVRTAISPTWEDIGKLAAIAAIRTVLSFFLERDLKEFEGAGGEKPT